MNHDSMSKVLGFQLQTLIDAQKKESFHEPENVSNTEALGILISQYCDTVGTKILESFMYALEDSNYHKLSAIVGEWLDKGTA